MQLAEKNLRADWSESVLRDMTKLARTNLQYRRNSMDNAGAVLSSGPAAPPQGASSGMVMMTAPDGKKYNVPSDKVAAAKAQGWK